MKTKSPNSSKPKICSKRGCKKKLRSNSVGDTCYDHRQQTVKKTTKDPTKRKPAIKQTEKKRNQQTVNKRGLSKYLRKLDILLLIINPSGSSKMKLVFLDTADISPYKFFKAFTKLKGHDNVPIALAGLVSVKAKRDLTLADVSYIMKREVLDEVRRYSPNAELADFELSDPPKVLKVGESGKLVPCGKEIRP